MCGGARFDDRRTPGIHRITRDFGAYSHGNLAVYLIHGPSDDDREFLTLDEGLRAGDVIVREKGAGQGRDQAEVNSLEIENKSGKWLFLQAGDIVKGGKQDRTIMTDLTLPPGAPPTAIDAFCVERGRWTATNGPQFGGNTGLVSGVALKRAIQGEKNQARVWEEVAKADAKATDAARAGGHVMPASATRLSDTGTYNAIVENPTLRGDRKQTLRLPPKRRPRPSCRARRPARARSSRSAVRCISGRSREARPCSTSTRTRNRRRMGRRPLLSSYTGAT